MAAVDVPAAGAQTRAALVALPDPQAASAVVQRLVSDGMRVAVAGAALPGAELVVPDGAPSEAVARVQERLGGLDVLVCAAPPLPAGRFLDRVAAVWFADVDAALLVPFRLMRAAVPALRRSGDGRVVVVGAGWGPASRPGDSAAAAVHGGLVALVKTLARDLGPDGVTVNEVVADPEDAPAPEHLAAAVGYLVGSGAGAMVGQLLTLGRGGLLRP